MAAVELRILKVSDLINRRHPVTGASSIDLHSWVSDSRSNQEASSSSTDHPKHSGVTDEAPTPRILKPLNYPVLLVGTLDLPVRDGASTSKSSAALCSGSSCFSFSDGLSTVCCDVLDLDVRVIGKKIHVLAWNFFPFRCGGGFLEIIRWTFPESLVRLSWRSSNLDAFPLYLDHPTDNKRDSESCYYIYGALESVSPVSTVSCTVNCLNCISVPDTMLSRNNFRGFLAQILVCECHLCISVNSEIALKNLSVEKHNHFFIRPVIVYFGDCASSWRLVFLKLIGNAISLSGLTKKMFLIGKGESQLMHMATEKALLLLTNLRHLRLPIRKACIEGKGEIGSYMGTVTGIFMQGMVVELDSRVLLLLTDQQLDVPHSLRVGAIASIKNVHFVFAKFTWMENLVLGSCSKTTVTVKSFSPMDTGCHLQFHSKSLLRKFIDSLMFPVRLWYN